MPIEQWSDRIGIAHLANEPHLAENLQSAQELTASKPVDLVLDFGAVKYLNSSHIARLLKLRKSMINEDKRLVLCALDTQVWSAFLVTGLDKVFEFADSVPTALAALQIARKS
jgi:anti-anti-sigma factor